MRTIFDGLVEEFRAWHLFEQQAGNSPRRDLLDLPGPGLPDYGPGGYRVAGYSGPGYGTPEHGRAEYDRAPRHGRDLGAGAPQPGRLGGGQR
jgi:hypothetical protein